MEYKELVMANEALNKMFGTIERLMDEKQILSITFDEKGEGAVTLSADAFKRFFHGWEYRIAREGDKFHAWCNDVITYKCDMNEEEAVALITWFQGSDEEEEEEE